MIENTKDEKIQIDVLNRLMNSLVNIIPDKGISPNQMITKYVSNTFGHDYFATYESMFGQSFTKFMKSGGIKIFISSIDDGSSIIKPKPLSEIYEMNLVYLCLYKRKHNEFTEDLFLNNPIEDAL